MLNRNLTGLENELANLHSSTQWLTIFPETYIASSQSIENPNLTHEITSQISRQLLGAEVSCVQCHDSFLPNRYWTKHDFWSLDRHFQQLKFSNTFGTRFGHRILVDRPGLSLPTEVPTLNQGTIELTNATYFGMEMEEGKNNRSLRDLFLEHMIKDERFSRNFVNRIWKQFFSESLNHPFPITDLDISEVTHPELLNTLATEFAADRFNFRNLMTHLCQTQLYTLPSTTPDTSSSNTFLSYYPLKYMDGPTLAQSILTALGYREGAAFSQIRFETQSNSLIELLAQENRRETDEQLIDVQESLTFLNSLLLQEFIKNSPLLNTIQSESFENGLEVIYQCMFSRSPSKVEFDRLKIIKDNSKSTAIEFWFDIILSVLNSAEFRTNH